MRRFAPLAIAVLSMATAASSATAETFTIGNQSLSLDSTITPSKLPQKKRVPASLHFHIGITNTAGTGRPSAMQDVSLDFNRAGITDINGLSTCSEAKLANTTTADAMRVCG